MPQKISNYFIVLIIDHQCKTRTVCFFDPGASSSVQGTAHSAGPRMKRAGGRELCKGVPATLRLGQGGEGAFKEQVLLPAELVGLATVPV